MAGSNNSLRTPLGRVRGLGASRRGTGHFIALRTLAVALVPLGLWFLWAVISHAGAPYAEVAAFFAHPVNAGLMLTFVVVALWHFRLGFEETILDYVTHDGLKVAALIANTFFSVIITVAAVLAILKLAL
ncbi:MAG: succinate dehydrogenase, hydrophobic membrane anchor protein [Micropepsaceae bacterium]